MAGETSLSASSSAPPSPSCPMAPTGAPLLAAQTWRAWMLSA